MSVDELRRYEQQRDDLRERIAELEAGAEPKYRGELRAQRLTLSAVLTQISNLSYLSTERTEDI